MAATTELLMPLDGTEYPSWRDLRLALDNWAVKEKFSFRTPKKDPLSAAVDDCGWKCRARRNGDGLVILTGCVGFCSSTQRGHEVQP
jgi:hypothetical protein